MTSEKRSDSDSRPSSANSREPKVLLATDESRLLGANVYGASPATADEDAARRAFQFRSFHCPICFANIAIRREQAGQKLVCPDCLSEIVAPTDLNFDSQTEYEKRYFNEEKKKRDELLSPTRNPNRVGIDLSSPNVYGVSQSSEESKQSDKSLYVAIRCAVCGTIIQIPRAELGAKVRCPDCFTEIVARDDKTSGVETASERKKREEEKKKRDELYSPTRNPNREGIDFRAHDVYGISDSQTPAPSPVSSETSSSTTPPQAAKRPKSVLYPVRCRVCETIMHVPRERLGEEVTCPDCGTVTVATAVLKEQQKAIDTKFQPRDRGTYDLGAVPLPPSATYRTERGKTIQLDGSKPMIAPTERRESEAITLEEFKKKHGIEPSSNAKPQSSSNVASKDKKSIAAKPKKKRKQERQGQESSEANLPPRVLRRRNGEFVWATASPPTPVPLFNGALSPLCGIDLWARAVVLSIVFTSLVVLFSLGQIANEIGVYFLQAAARLLFVIGVVPLSAFFLAIFTHFFTTIYRSSSMGARRVLDWTNDEQMTGLVLSGMRFALFVIVSVSCGFGLIRLAVRALVSAGFTEIPSLPIALTLFAIGCVLSLFFFAVFWISSDAKGAFFCPITLTVLSTFIRRKATWLLFTLYALFVLTPIIVVCALAFDISILLFAATSSLAIPLLAILSSPIIGRLAWIVEDYATSLTFDD